MKVKTKTKWMLAVVAAVCLSALIVLPLYALTIEERVRIINSWGAPQCPPPGKLDGRVLLIPEPGDCGFYWECNNGAAFLHRCPCGLFFCSEKDSCSWAWDAACTFDCVAVN